MLHEHANEDYYDCKFKRLNHLAAWALTLKWSSSLYQFVHAAISYSITRKPLFRSSD